MAFKPVRPPRYDPTDPTEDTEPQTEFGDKNFVSVSSKGISFSLSAPKPAKPVPPTPRPSSPGPELETAAASDAGRRSGAAAFFLSEVNRLNSKKKEAKVPLPPSFGYDIDDSGDEEEDGPPGMAPLKKLPALKFDQPFSKDAPKDNVEAWKRIEMPDLYKDRRKPESWTVGVVLQDPALFLQEESGRSGTELITEIEHTDVPGLCLSSVKMKVSYNYLHARASDSSRKEAMNQCAVKILKDTGPWLDPSVVDAALDPIKAILPKMSTSWLPFKYNLKHVRLHEKEGGLKQTKCLYELTVRLGPLSCSAIGDSVDDSLQYTTLHLKSFIKNRNLGNLSPPFPRGRLSYTTGRGILRVVMEDKGRQQVLPPLDLAVLQDVLTGGEFPPLYSNRDIHDCTKVFYCDACGHRVLGVDNLIKHIQGERHNNRLGKFTMKGTLVETFRSNADPEYGQKFVPPKETQAEAQRFQMRLCSSCEEEKKTIQATHKCKDCNDFLCDACREAHTKTRLTKSHVVEEVEGPAFYHPILDDEQGGRGEDEAYLISVYRCPTRVQPNQDDQEPEEEVQWAGDVYEGEDYQDSPDIVYQGGFEGMDGGPNFGMRGPGPGGFRPRGGFGGDRGGFGGPPRGGFGDRGGFRGGFGGDRGGFGGPPRGGFGPPRGGFGGGPPRFGGPGMGGPPRFGGPPGDDDGPPGESDGPPGEGPEGGPGGFGGGRGGFGGDRGGFRGGFGGPPRGGFGGPPGGFQGGPGGPGGFRPRGPGGFQGGPGGFQGGPGGPGGFRPRMDGGFRPRMDMNQPRFGPHNTPVPQGGPRFPGPIGPSGAPSNMVCVSQGTSGQQCKHFGSGNCTYGPRCIHMHMVPAGPVAKAPGPAGPKNVKEGDSDDEEEGEGGEEGGGGDDSEDENDPLAIINKRRDEAKRRAYAEALEAAKMTTRNADNLNIGNLRGPDKGSMQGITNLPQIEGGLLHAYSVGQKGKKKDKPPDEQRPGDWLCECQNYNFSWRKNCNACTKKKPLNKMEEEAKKAELQRIKDERAKRLKDKERDGDLRKIAERKVRAELSKRDRSKERGDRGSRGRDRSRDRDRGSRRDRGGRDDENPNTVPIGGSRSSRRKDDDDDDDRSSHRDRKKSRHDRDDDDDDDRRHKKHKSSRGDSDDEDRDRSSKKKKKDRDRSRSRSDSRSKRRDRSRSKKKDRGDRDRDERGDREERGGHDRGDRDDRAGHDRGEENGGDRRMKRADLEEGEVSDHGNSRWGNRWDSGPVPPPNPPQPPLPPRYEQPPLPPQGHYGGGGGGYNRY